MPHRRILSLWFPRLAAEWWIRVDPHLAKQPMAVVAHRGQMQMLSSVSLRAAQAGLRAGQPLRDAHAMCAGLLTRPEDPHREAMFLATLHRWAGKFAPWVSQEPPDALVIDLTGCAHLFGGEAALSDQIIRECHALGLTAQLGIGDTLGMAWALARFSASDATGHRSGDAIDQEAPATRARAGKKRHWERGGAAPPAPVAPALQGRIAPSGPCPDMVSPLPVAALRITPAMQADLSHLGMRCIGNLLAQPRAGLARRFGQILIDRLDQVVGALPEPISPESPRDRVAVRLGFPEPIGLDEDVVAGLVRLLERLCVRLEAKARGARAIRIEVYRCDHSMQWLTVQAAVVSCDPQRLMPLLRLKLSHIDAGPGIDMLRLEAVGHEPLHTRHTAGHRDAAARAARAAGLEDLLGRLGARVGMEAITRHHPAQSHIPDHAAQVLAAAWSEPSSDWRPPETRRPLLLWPAEPVKAPDRIQTPDTFRWRGREFRATRWSGPERITPEWWLEDPAWRSGARDYWQVETDHGDCLWLFYAHGALKSSGWFCQGSFA